MGTKVPGAAGPGTMPPASDRPEAASPTLDAVPAEGDRSAAPAGAPADADRFDAAAPAAPAVDAAAALAQRAAGFGEPDPVRAAAVAGALGNLLAASSGRSLPHGQRLERTDEFGTLGAFALEGDAAALAALDFLVTSGAAFSGPARVLLANRERLQAAARLADPIEFGRSYVAFGDEIVEDVRALLDQGIDPARRRQFVHDAVDGLLQPLRIAFLRRFAGDHSVEVSAIRHEIMGCLESVLMALGLDSPDDARMAADLVVAPIAGEDLYAQLLRAVRYPRAFAEVMRVSLRYDVPRGLRFRQGFDPALVLQGFGELIWNAAKYHVGAGERKERFVRLSWDAARGAFIVEDNGSGIEHPERVFEAGYREAARYADERRGTGMGLANLKRHLDEIGWTIEVSSEVNVGTRFIITPKGGDVVEGTPSPAPGGGSFGGVVEEGGSGSGGGGESAASAEPLDDAAPAAVMGAETMIGADAAPLMITPAPPPLTPVR